MAQCPRCKVVTAYFDRHIQTCGHEEEPYEAVYVVLTGKDLFQACLSHLLAIPGMLIFLVGFIEFGFLSLVSLHIAAPWFYRWNNSESEIIWNHTTEALNFQVVWTAAMWIAMVIVPFFGMTLWPFVWVSGILLVLFIVIDVINHGKGRYPVRIPLFHHH